MAFLVHQPNNYRGKTRKFQTAIISSILIQIERATQQLKALPTHNLIMYITSTHSTHLVQDMQEPHFWQKSKIEILDFCLHQRINCVCWGLANSWEGRNDVQSHLFAFGCSPQHWIFTLSHFRSSAWTSAILFPIQLALSSFALLFLSDFEFTFCSLSVWFREASCLILAE